MKHKSQLGKQLGGVHMEHAHAGLGPAGPRSDSLIETLRF
jgi:hypothetical protein